MPYQIQSQCAACQQGDEFIIGDWTRYFGVYLCKTCQKLVNIATSDGKCTGCGYKPDFQAYYDYAFAIPYLGGQTLRQLDTGPDCPRCGKAKLAFTNTMHLNMGMVAFNEEGAKATWGIDYMEKAIFMNSCIPVIQEFDLDPVKVFAYFHLHIPAAPLVTKRLSYPIILDIRTHLMVKIMTQPNDFKRT